MANSWYRPSAARMPRLSSAFDLRSSTVPLHARPHANSVTRCWNVIMNASDPDKLASTNSSPSTSRRMRNPLSKSSLPLTSRTILALRAESYLLVPTLARLVPGSRLSERGDRQGLLLGGVAGLRLPPRVAERHSRWRTQRSGRGRRCRAARSAPSCPHAWRWAPTMARRRCGSVPARKLPPSPALICNHDDTLAPEPDRRRTS